MGSARLRRCLHRQPLLLIAASSATGIVMDAVVCEGERSPAAAYRVVFWISLSLAGSTIMLSRFGLRRSGLPRSGLPRSGLLCAVVFLPLAACRHCLHEFSYRQAELLSLVGAREQAAVLEGVIDRPIVLRRHPLAPWRAAAGDSPWQTQLELQLRQLRLGQRMQACNGRVLVVVDADCSARRPGDVLRVFGKLRALTGPTNPGEPDRRAYYRQRRLHARVDCVSADQLLELEAHPGLGNRILALVTSIANKGRQTLFQQMEPANASLAAALVLGQREFVDESTRDLLLVTGTAHLLSVSGLHLAIVVTLASWLANFGRFSLSLKILWIVSICLLYTSITGLRPPVVRAAILVGTLMLALWIKRPAQPINTISLAAVLLMGINPLLVFNMGVQLSFLAVLTLVTCCHQATDHREAIRDQIDREQRLRRLVDRSYARPVRWLRAGAHRLGQATWFSGCVTVISTPLLWFHFHVVAPISVVTNVVLSPLLLVSLVSGVSTVLAGFLSQRAAALPAMVCEPSLVCMSRIIEFAAAIPHGHQWLPAPPAWWVAAFYIAIAISMLLTPSRPSSLLRYTWILLWFPLAGWMATRPPKLPADCLEATFVNVGHGTSAMLRFSDDEVWLYDCGRLGNETSSSRGIDSALWSMGTTEITGIFLSHADADHFNALPGLLRRFKVGAIYAPANVFQSRQPALRDVLRQVQHRGIDMIELASGSIAITSGYRMRVLHPPAGPVGGTDNANSLVLAISNGGKSLLLPGDLESPGTELLIRHERPAPGGVLMAPHHGSLSRDAVAVLQWGRPSAVAVSGGRRAGRPEVERMLAQTGASVHVTSEEGAIRVRIDHAGQISVCSWRDTPW